MAGLLADLPRRPGARAAGSSSWDITGRNKDAWVVNPGGSAIPSVIGERGCDHAAVVREGRRRPEALLGRELPARLEDPNQQSTVGPCRVCFGSPPTRAQERAGFV